MQLSAGGTLTVAARAEAASAIADAIVSYANDSGGWGYFRGKTSRLEPSCWALLALSHAQRVTRAGHRAFLDRAGRADGLFVDQPGAPPNFTDNGLVLLTMLDQAAPAAADRLRALIASIVAVSGVRTPPSPAIRQDNMLEGWPWIADTFSWVEPTSWCLLALKRAATLPRVPDATHRIAEAEKLLADRCCESGGWNYGNSNVLGANLPPYVSSTAIALLALQDRKDLPAVTKSLAFLERHATAEPSGMALSLALICLRIYGRPTADVEAALVAQWRRTALLGNVHVLGMALCALSPAAEALSGLRL